MTLMKRGEAYRMQRRYEEALRDANRALELDPNNALALEQRELLPQQFGQ